MEKNLKKVILIKLDKINEKKIQRSRRLIIKYRKRRVKFIRNISKKKEKFQNKKNERKRDIIIVYKHLFDTKVYTL